MEDSLSFDGITGDRKHHSSERRYQTCHSKMTTIHLFSRHTTKLKRGTIVYTQREIQRGVE